MLLLSSFIKSLETIDIWNTKKKQKFTHEHYQMGDEIVWEVEKLEKFDTDTNVLCVSTASDPAI